MNTCIISMPRTASKTVMFYFSCYYRKKYTNIASTVIPVLGKTNWSLGELLNTDSPEWFGGTAILATPNEIIVTDEKIESVEHELAKRFDIIANLENPFIIKYFPRGIDFMDKILAIAPDVHYISRKNIFEHSLSWALSTTTQSWMDGKLQYNIIRNIKNNPIVIDTKVYLGILREILEYNTKYIDNNKSVDFEDIIALDNAKDFCELFDLEFVNFNFFKTHVEFGKDKSYLIANIDELHRLFMQEMNKRF